MNRNKRKGMFSKFVLIGMFLFLIIFTGVILMLFKETAAEPATLITAVFAFCGAEGGALAWIKTIKQKKESKNDLDN